MSLAHHAAPARSICLVSSSMAERTLRLQPWRYLHETARQLAAQGHRVTIISDGAQAPAPLEGVRVLRLPSVSVSRWQRNRPLHAALRQLAPNVTLWHVGLTSFLHQEIPADLPGASVGIFTSPLYQPREIARLGLRRIVEGRALSGTHVAGTFAPRLWLETALRRSALRSLVVQSEATRRRLEGYGLGAERVRLIAPGVDEAWSPAGIDAATRGRLGYTACDTVVLYFGSPARLRGLHSLVEAVALARRSDPSLKLLVLSRRRADELLREDASLRRLLARSDIQPHVQLVSGFLGEAALVGNVAASDIVALPFELIPSDAPLSLLEAQALGRPVVTTELGCLPELVANGPHYLARPADPRSLAQALLAASRDLRREAAPLANIAFEPRRWQQVGEEWSHLVQTL